MTILKDCLTFTISGNLCVFGTYFYLMSYWIILWFFSIIFISRWYSDYRFRCILIRIIVLTFELCCILFPSLPECLRSSEAPSVFLVISRSTLFFQVYCFNFLLVGMESADCILFYLTFSLINAVDKWLWRLSLQMT